MGNSNELPDGFQGIDYINNLGCVWSQPEFPDSLAAEVLGGAHTLVLSGQDMWGASTYDILSHTYSGFKGQRSPMLDHAGGWYWLATGFADPAMAILAGSRGLWPFKWFYSGTDGIAKTTRWHWDTRPTEEGGPMGNANAFTWANNIGTTNLGGAFHTGALNLRKAFGLPDTIAWGEDYKNISPNFKNHSFYTNQTVGIIDLISEGPIEGLVSGTYIYSVSGKNAGDIGYASVEFNKFTTQDAGVFSTVLDPSQIVPPEARSIFWNDTPVATNDGLFNFRYVNYKYDYGSPNLHTISNPYINLYEDRYHYDGYLVDKNKYPVRTAVTRSIGERLYGPSFYSGIVSGVAPVKKYYVYNTDVDAIKINIRIDSLFSTVASGASAGLVRLDTMQFAVGLWRVFSDRKESFASMNRIQGNPTTFAKDAFKVIGKFSANPSLIHYTFWIRPYAEEGYFFEVLPNQIGWAVEVNKVSQENNQYLRKSSTAVDSITEIYSNRLTYPNVAMVYNNFDAKYFSNIPTRKYRTRLLKVKVPTNYNSLVKTYSGAWDGTFKLEWTDNPAWCFYDLITNNRFGLGKYIDPRLVDKWSLYEVSQYCDQLVPDGEGGLEPRFTCNVMISAKEEAYKVLNDMASIFNGLVYYSAGQIFVNQDRPKEPIYLFNNSNIINGEFSYSNSAKKARRSVALVRFNDQYNNYAPAIEYVEDKSSLIKYGIREVEVTAFGATKRSQAKRLGRWFLTSENLETETVNFDVGLEGTFLKPGDIISIYDQNRRNAVYAGRTLELNTGRVTLDILDSADSRRALTGAVDPISINFLTPTYNLNFGTYLGDLYGTGFGTNITSSGSTGLNSSFFRRSQVQTMTISNPKNYLTSGTGNYTGYIAFTFPSGLSGAISGSPGSGNYYLPQNTVWTIDFDPALYSGNLNNRSSINNPQLLLYPGWYLEGYLNETTQYRVVNVREKENQIFSVTALEYVPQKYTDIVTGESLISVPTRQAAPTAPQLSLSILYRDISGRFGDGGNPPPYTTNQNGVNSIAYKITPPSNSGVVSNYYLYRKFESAFNANEILDQYLFDTQSSNLKDQDLKLPLGSITGNLPPLFTPTVTGTWYIGLLATNNYGERSPFVTSSIYLGNQASISSVYASGVNIAGAVASGYGGGAGV